MTFTNLHERFENAKKQMPVVGILRDIPVGQEEACIQTAAACGLSLLEVTMNTKDAPTIIQSLRHFADSYGITVGAGTVRSMEDLINAYDAGALFIVTPTMVPEIIGHCVEELKLPIIPGALTPTEIETAFQNGASCVKVFPIQAMGGPTYIRELRGPFRDIPLLACGGVNAENAAAYLQSGADLLAFGGSIFAPHLMEVGDWETIGNRLKELLNAVRDVLKE